MTWWQNILLVSGGVAWAFIALAALLIIVNVIRIKRQLGGELQEKPFDITQYTWIHTEDGSKPPVRVPKDLTKRAIELMDRDSSEKFAEDIQPTTYTVPSGNIRAAMIIAQQEPDLEVAMATWLANYIR